MSYTQKKQNMSNTILSLIEEELHQRICSGKYHDNNYDGTNMSICGSSNLDIATLENKNMSDCNKNMSGGDRLKNGKYNLLPGKFDIVRNSYHVPLHTAIIGTLERQKLFLSEISHNNKQ